MAEQGSYHIVVGASSRDLKSREAFELAQTGMVK
jgi:hypothetical protein